MTDLTLVQFGAIALLLTGWLAIIAVAALKGWNGWLALKAREIDLLAGARQSGPDAATALPAAARIDLADLKERIRKLEAIAAGVDL